MIYEVYVDDKLLYYPNDETYVISNAKLELALNEAGSFEFDVPSINLRYDDFENRRSMVKVLQNNIEIFYGEVREIGMNNDTTKHIYAVGELAFLFDSIQPQKKYQCSPLEMFTKMLNIHNSQVESRKQFRLGSVMVSDPNNYVYHFTDYEDTLTAIREKLCNTLGGYLRIRKDPSGKYLDMTTLESYGSYCSQEIQFGENLINFSTNLTSQDIATAVIPLGARLDEDKRTSRSVEGLDEYVDIVDVKADAYKKNDSDNYVYIDSAVNKFGWVKVVKKWDEVEDPQNLKNKAVEWLKTAQYASMVLELNAFDMNLLDANIDSFDIGDTVHAWAKPYGMDAVFPVQKKTIYLNALENNRIVLGNSYKDSFTKQSSNAVNDLSNMIPEVSPILEGAKQNALKLLNGSVGGYVIFKFDKTESYIEQLLICNASKEENSTQKWVWNLKGFGYMYRKSISHPWTDMNVAITMDGHIVANFITTGLLRLTGAVSAGNHDNNSAMHLMVYDGSNLVGSWGSDGIMIGKGTIHSQNYAYYANKGAYYDAQSQDVRYVYSNAGTEIDLLNGRIRSQNFCIDDYGNAYFGGVIHGNQLIAGTVTTSQINFTPIMDDANGAGKIVGYINAAENGITIGGDRINIEGNTTFTSTRDAASAAKGKTDGLANGTTTISGGCITTGNIQSNNYSYKSGNFNEKGSIFALGDGTIRTKNFCVDKDGNVFLNNGLIKKDANNYIDFSGDTKGNYFQIGNAYFTKGGGGELHIPRMIIQETKDKVTYTVGITAERITVGSNHVTWKDLVNLDDRLTDLEDRVTALES